MSNRGGTMENPMYVNAIHLLCCPSQCAKDFQLASQESLILHLQQLGTPEAIINVACPNSCTPPMGASLLNRQRMVRYYQRTSWPQNAFRLKLPLGGITSDMAESPIHGVGFSATSVFQVTPTVLSGQDN